MTDGIDDSQVPSGGMPRRDFVKKSAILGGMVWAAPAVTTLGSRAFASGTPINGAGDPCDNFKNFKIEQDANGNWAFVSCPSVKNQGDCEPDGYERSGHCMPLKTGNQLGVESDDGRVKLDVDGDTFTLTVAPGCKILQGGAVGGRGPDTQLDPCVYFEPNGTDQTWEASVPQGDLSNILGYICCDSPF